MRSTTRRRSCLAVIAGLIWAGAAYPDGDSSTLVYSTYLGGEKWEEARAVAVDAAGNASLTGSTLSADFPVLGGIGNFDHDEAKGFHLWDAFVARLGPDGTLVHSTYLGDDQHDDFALDIALDSEGRAFPTGYWTNIGDDHELWLARLDPGTAAPRLFSLQYGEKADQSRAVAIDAAGEVYIAGLTCSYFFPGQVGVLQNACDTFIVKWGASTTIFLGGDGSTAAPWDIAVDDAGNVYLTGNATAGDFPLVNALPGPSGESGDAFVAKLDSSGALVYSTFLGGSGLDQGYGIAVDAAGNAYVTGSTASADFPVPEGGEARLSGGSDVFVVKLAPDGSLLSSILLGGTGADSGRSIALGPGGAVWLAGQTASADFPVRNPLQDACAAPCADAFVARLDAPATRLVFSTFLGGGAQDAAFGIASDPEGNAVVTGHTASADFPTRNAWQPTLAGDADAFVAKILGNQPPDCSGATARPGVVWPPNRRLVPVSMAGVTDPEGDPVTFLTTGIRQDEPRTGSEPDATSLGTREARVRADRNGRGDGRVYHIAFEARDAQGAACTGEVEVCVPHDARAATCGDGGALVDSTR